MVNEVARTLGLTLLAVLTIALAAGGFTGAIQTGPLEDFGLGNAPATQSPGDGDTNRGIIGGQASRTSLGLPLFCIGNPWFVYGIPILMIAGAIYLFERFDTWIASRTAVGFGLLLGIPYAVLVACPEQNTGLAAPADFGSVFARAGTDVPTPMPVSSLLLIGVLTVGVIGVVILIRRFRNRLPGSGDGRFSVDFGPRPANPQTDLAGVADAAGSAADRLDGAAELDNEVYRAWREMTEHLEVDRPAASTPGEFEAAAVEAGLAPEDVSALTRVFEAVRYGDDDPTVHEDEAIAALRRIEDAAAELSADYVDS